MALKKQPWLTNKVILAMALWLFFMVGLPYLLRRRMILRARHYAEDLRPTKKESSLWRLLFGSVWFVTLFLLVNPGVFFITFISQMKWWWASPVFILFAYIFLGATNANYFSMRNEKKRRELYEKLKSNKLRRGDSNSSTNIWDSGLSMGSSSGSSSGFSGSSSSSGGGSSGGGDASGSW